MRFETNGRDLQKTAPCLQVTGAGSKTRGMNKPVVGARWGSGLAGFTAVSVRLNPSPSAVAAPTHLETGAGASATRMLARTAVLRRTSRQVRMTIARGGRRTPRR